MQKISVLSDRERTAFDLPLLITWEGYILDGRARWQLAKQQGRAELRCLRRQISAEDALLHLLQSNHRSTHLNDFNRIILALELEPWFRSKARANQQAAGRNKLSSDLTKAESVDVRERIAGAAGVSPANVTNVKRLQVKAAKEVLEALRLGDIRIGRACDWIKTAEDGGRQALKQHKTDGHMKREIDKLLSDVSSETPKELAERRRHNTLSALEPNELQRLLRDIVKIVPEDAILKILKDVGICLAH